MGLLQQDNTDCYSREYGDYGSNEPVNHDHLYRNDKSTNMMKVKGFNFLFIQNQQSSLLL